MEKKELREEFVSTLKECVVNFEEEKVKQVAQKVIEEGLDAYDAIMNGLAAGMEVVGDLYDKHEYFVPELLMAADTLYAGLDILRPHYPDADDGQYCKHHCSMDNGYLPGLRDLTNC